MFNKDYNCEDAIRKSAKAISILVFIPAFLLIFSGGAIIITSIIDGSDLIMGIAAGFASIFVGIVFEITGSVTVNLLYAQGEHLAVQKEMLEENIALRLALTKELSEIKDSISENTSPRRTSKGVKIPKSKEEKTVAADGTWTCKCGMENHKGATICHACFQKKPKQ